MKSKKAISPLMLIIVILIIAILTGVLIIAFYSYAAPQTAKQATESFFGPLAPMFMNLAKVFGIDVTSGVFISQEDIIFSNGATLWRCHPSSCFKFDENAATYPKGVSPGCEKIKSLDKNIYGVSVADINADDFSDILFTYKGEKTIRALNGKDGKIIELGKANSELVGLGAGDINKDGKIELIATTDYNEMISCNSSDETHFSCQTEFTSTYDFTDAALADLDKDGVYDNFVAGTSNGYLVFYSNTKPRWWVGCNTNLGNITGVGIGDVDDDGIDEAIITNGSTIIWSCKLSQDNLDNCDTGKPISCEPLCLTNLDKMRGIGVVS